MPDYNYNDETPWYNDRNKIKTVVIEDGVTSIGNCAFYYCKSLTSITIGNSVTSIGESAFEGCSSLTSITIPNSVTRIEMLAFWGCSGLTSVTIPNSVECIGQSAFNVCSALTSITFGNSVASIENYALEWCKNLTSITFKGSTPPEFGEYVFSNVDKSIPVYVPSSSVDEYKKALGGYFEETSIQPITIYLTEGDAYTNDSQIDNVDVSYTRDFSGGWESICLPFSLEYKDWKDDFEVARINGIHQYDDNDDGDIDRTILEFVKMKNDDSVIEPNTPYLIKAKKAGKKTISVENTTVYEAKANSIECSTTTEQFTFIGLYKKPSLWSIGQLARGKNYVMYKGNLSKLTTLSDIGPYCWYMTRENRNSAYGINNNNTAKEISIRVVGEETTGIANIQLTSPNTQTYDLNGRKVNENNLKPGMYVKNGKKIIIK